MQVKSEAKGGFILSFTLIKLKTGVKMPVKTAARIIIDIKGHISHTSIAIERIKRTRKKPKMIFRELPSRIVTPRTKSISTNTPIERKISIDSCSIDSCLGPGIED